MAVFSTDVERPVATIIAQFVRRWNIEVTFEETRRHLGVETPASMVGPGHCPHHAGFIRPVFPGVSDGAPPGRPGPGPADWVTAWYRKSEATFSDVLAMVSRVLWAEKYFTNSMDQPNLTD